MKLDVNDPRKELIFRMQAYAYENVIRMHMPRAQEFADFALASFDATKEQNPTHNMGFWSGQIYQPFVQDCETLI